MPETSGEPASESPLERRFEKATDRLRQVVRTVDGIGRVVVTVQREWITQDGPLMDGHRAFPPADEDTWMRHPNLPFDALVWFPVRREWRSLETVTQAQVDAEKVAGGVQPSISTDA